MKIAIASDHAGFAYKERIRTMLLEAGHDVRDFGTFSEEPCEYPRLVRPVAEAVARGAFERGIVVGGSGNGEAIVANRVRGVRCAVGWDLRSAKLSREHNDANLLALGERMISIEAALEIVQLWLATPFAGGRHAERIREIDEG
jgi:ribose 5-phosphate isomerase B